MVAALGTGTSGSVFPIGGSGLRTEWVRAYHPGRREVDRSFNINHASPDGLVVKLFFSENGRNAELENALKLTSIPKVLPYTDFFLHGESLVLAKIEPGSVPDGYRDVGIVKHRARSVESLDGEYGPAEKSDITRSLLRALTFAPLWLRKIGMFHNDIKPGNLLVSNTGRVMLTDWGSMSDDQVGTPIYSTTVYDEFNDKISTIFEHYFGSQYRDCCGTNAIKHIHQINSNWSLEFISDPILRHNMSVYRTLFWLAVHKENTFDVGVLAEAMDQCHEESPFAKPECEGRALIASRLVSLDGAWRTTLKVPKNPKPYPAKPWRGGDELLQLLTKTIPRKPSESGGRQVEEMLRALQDASVGGTPRNGWFAGAVGGFVLFLTAIAPR